MELIGMLDSPYVRRVAISLQLLGIEFTHRSLSVFGGYDEFRAINPVVKAPTLVCDDGTVLMDSTLILAYAESLAPGRSLLPAAPAGRLAALRRVGLALAACEKSVQIVYEHRVRPAEKRHAPWLERVTAQLLAAFGELEREFGQAQVAAEAPLDSETIGQDTLSAAVAWRFHQQTLPGVVDPAHFPVLARLSDDAERLPAFRAAPHGDGTCPVTASD